MNAMRPTLPLTGGCPCGAIRYEISGFPLLLYACNCTDCQKRSGSAFAVNMPVSTTDLHIVQGAPKAWHHISPSGVPVSSWFCGDCGGRVYGERSGRPESMVIRAGTLDDTTWLVPIAHNYMRSAQRWGVPAVDAQCYETSPDDFGRLAKAWRAMWPEFFPGK